MRILLTSEFFLSGQSTHVLDLAIQLKQLGHQVTIIFTRIHTPLFNEHYGPWIKQAGIKYYNTNNTTRIRQIIKGFKPSIIHCHSSTLFNLTQEMAKLRDIPFVVTCHGLGFAHEKYKTALESAKGIIAVGSNSASEILPSYEDKVVIIPNGVDIERFTPHEKEQQLIVYYAGRIDRSKVTPIKKLAQVINQIPGIQLKIIGNWSPPIRNIQFIPWQPWIENIFKRANIVIGCGRTAREALASGCVVLLLNTQYDGLIDGELTKKPDFDFSGNLGRFNYNRLYVDLYALQLNKRRLVGLQEFSRQYAVEHLSSKSMAKKILSLYEQVMT